MRTSSICLLLITLSLGCNPAEQARRKAAQENLERIGEELKNDHQTNEASIAQFSHVIAAEAVFYTNGPQQSRPPDGTLPAGTKVNIVEEAGSYVRVRSSGGIDAYVAAGSVKQQTAAAEDVSDTMEGGSSD